MRGKYLKFTIVLINLAFAFHFSSVDFTFRRIKGILEISPPSGINGEILFRNLYALFNCSPEEMPRMAMELLYNTPIAKEKLGTQEVERMGVSYGSYSGNFENCGVASWRVGREPNLWDLFGKHFLHVLNTSGSIERVIKLVQYIVTANYIAGESKDRIENPLWNQRGGVTSPIDYHLSLFRPEGKAGVGPLDRTYKWESLDKDERRTIMAFAYIILVSKDTKNMEDFLEVLSEDEEARKVLLEIKTIIENLYLEESLKQKVLKIFPQENP